MRAQPLQEELAPRPMRRLVVHLSRRVLPARGRYWARPGRRAADDGPGGHGHRYFGV